MRKKAKDSQKGKEKTASARSVWVANGEKLIDPLPSVTLPTGLKPEEFRAKRSKSVKERLKAFGAPATEKTLRKIVS